MADGYFDLCDTSKYFDEATGVLNAMSLTDADEYPINLYSITPEEIYVSIRPVIAVEDLIFPEMSTPMCHYGVKFTPYTDNNGELMENVVPFPFADETYRLAEPDFLIATWTDLSDLAYHHMGSYGSTFLDGYSVEFWTMK